jgi:acetyl/propionyl-CoA carboxylase alpha subunit
LIKASAGGGEKECENEEEFEPKIRAISEAINALVMMLLFIEKYVVTTISKFKL